jgi:hypothetical protein
MSDRWLNQQRQETHDRIREQRLTTEAQAQRLAEARNRERVTRAASRAARVDADEM